MTFCSFSWRTFYSSIFIVFRHRPIYLIILLSISAFIFFFCLFVCDYSATHFIVGHFVFSVCPTIFLNLSPPLGLSFCHPVSSSVLLTAWPLPPWIDIMTFAIERLFRECTRWLGPSPIANDIPRCVQSSPVYKPSWSSETKLTGQPWRPAIQRFWNGPSATGQTRLKSLGELKNNCNHFLPAICR